MSAQESKFIRPFQPSKGERMDFSKRIKTCEIQQHPHCRGKFYLVWQNQTACEFCMGYLNARMFDWWLV